MTDCLPMTTLPLLTEGIVSFKELMEEMLRKMAQEMATRTYFSPLTVNELVRVQPMSEPAPFFLQYRFEEATGKRMTDDYWDNTLTRYGSVGYRPYMKEWRREFPSLGPVAGDVISVQPMKSSAPDQSYLDCPTCAGVGHGACLSADALAKEHDDYVAANYPHTCPRCSAPAYVGFEKVECSEPSCR